MLSELTDKELLQKDNPEAFRVLYDRYWQSLFLKAKARLRTDDDAKDILQEIFISIWNNRHRIELEDSIAPYLYTALKFSIIKKVTREYNRGVIYPLDVEKIKTVSLSPDELLLYKQLDEMVQKEIDALPERMKQIYLMSKEQQLKNREIARQLNLSEQTVKNTLSTAVNRLRDSLSSQKFSIFFI